MKKAKLSLTVIAVLAVVGGAMAFKASNPGGLKLYYQPLSQPDCTVPTTFTSFVLDLLGTSTLSFHTTSIKGPCPGVIVRFQL